MCEQVESNVATATAVEIDMMPPLPKAPKLISPGSVHGAKKQATLHRFGFRPAATTDSATCSDTKSPTSVVDYHGLKIYNEKEIREAPGTEKDFRLFWNEQAKELCTNSAVRLHLGNKSGLVGAIKTSWVLHKSDLLQLRYDELEKLAQVYGDESTIARKLESPQNNLARMHKARIAVQQTYEDISKSTSRSNKTMLSAQLTSHMSELRKAQDAFQKACKRKYDEIALLQQQKVIAQLEEPEEPAADSEEDYNIDQLVEEVKQEQDFTELNMCDETMSSSSAHSTVSMPLRGMAAYGSSSEDSD